MTPAASQAIGAEMAFTPELSDEERRLRAWVQSICRRLIGPQLTSWERTGRVDAAGVRALAESGLFSVLRRLPDGACQGWAALALALDEVARESASVAWLVLAQNLLRAFLPTELCDGVETGAVIVTLADHEEQSVGPPVGAGLGTRVTTGERGMRLTGTKRNVLFASIATHLVVTAGSEAPGGGRFLVRAGERGCLVSPIVPGGLRSAGFGDVALSSAPAIPVCPWTATSAAFSSVWRALGTLIEIANGLAAVAFMVQDARRKRSFGKPLLKWQAIQFKLTDGYLKLSMVRMMAHYFAWVLDQRLHVTGSGLDVDCYAALLRTMYCKLGQEVQEYCVELGSGRAYRVGHPAWRRYMDFVTLLLLAGGDDPDRELLSRTLLRPASTASV